MSESPSRTTTAGTPSRLTKPILIAGLLGGLLGGVASFAGSRLIKPATSIPAPTAKDQATEEARHVVEEFLAMLKAGKKDEFMTAIKLGYTYLSEDVFKAFKQRFDNSRIEVGLFGASLQEFELLQATAVSPDLVQFVYLEKFEHGGVIWRFVMYHGKDSWRVAHVIWNPDAREAFVQ